MTATCPPSHQGSRQRRQINQWFTAETACGSLICSTYFPVRAKAKRLGVLPLIMFYRPARRMARTYGNPTVISTCCHGKRGGNWATGYTSRNAENRYRMGCRCCRVKPDPWIFRYVPRGTACVNSLLSPPTTDPRAKDDPATLCNACSQY